MDELTSGGKKAFLLKKQADGFTYVGGNGGILAYQKVPCKAVKVGEPWGGPGNRATQDYPAVRATLFANGESRMVEEAEFQTLYGWLLRGEPNPQSAQSRPS